MEVPWGIPTYDPKFGATVILFPFHRLSTATLSISDELKYGYSFIYFLFLRRILKIVLLWQGNYLTTDHIFRL
jgi:hypothetical protein